MNRIHQIHLWKTLSLGIILGLFLTGCSYPSLGGSFLPGSPPVETQEMAEVVISVLVPFNTPIEEPIYLNTLDEVTGLGVNAQAHELTPVIEESDPEGGLTYQTTLTVPLNSTLKYRYSRQNQYAVIEHTEIDQQVRYRLLQVTGPMTVQDVVFKWSDTSYTGEPPGRISGKITDQETGEPLSGVLVTAGGVQAQTTADGTYLLPGLPPGIHNLVAYAMDGSYRINQQGAQVAAQANTEANLSLEPRNFVDVTFVVTVPPGTPEDSVRLAGNLFQLGNTFGNLAGGMNTIPRRMPKLTAIGLNQYGVILSLPVGAEIRYKYTLGDGFWNAEHTPEGQFNLRRLIVPDQPTQINDQVSQWGGGNLRSITFDLWTPEHTPENENIYIQFNPYGWTSPLPMMKINTHHWAYILYGPFEIISDLSYRYCRESECGIADDLTTRGENPPGRSAAPSNQPTYLADTVEGWTWFDPDPAAQISVPEEISPRDEGFLTGVEFMPGERPAYSDHLQDSITDLVSLHANHAVLSPTWSLTHQDPPVLEPDPSRDPSWFELSQTAQTVHDHQLGLVLFPKTHFPRSVNSWWETAPRDFSWWNSWFDQYHQFALHFARIAEQQNAETLVLGGRWLTPALPGGKLANGSPSGVPADADLRWREILADVQEVYQGNVAWAMEPPSGEFIPGYFAEIDQVYLDWNPALTETSPYTLEELSGTAAEKLSSEVKPFYEIWLKPDQKSLILLIGYPSVTDAPLPCLNHLEEADGEGTECLKPGSLTTPAPDLPGYSVDFQAQVDAYSAVLRSISEQKWISGVVSRGYYAPVELHDKSISVHGKPAESLLQTWFEELQK
ncbi:MAG: carboxypeptidase regulatory-like domain-containing protein [Anaerolineales bacterium]|nr:carboxypeptidase regulatory-like domain-containing protein [Anaerolineales bacterium]